MLTLTTVAALVVFAVVVVVGVLERAAEATTPAASRAAAAAEFAASAAREKPTLVRCATTKGNVDVVVQPWRAPLGAARFLELVDAGHFSRLPLFRCVSGFICQFGYRPAGDGGATEPSSIPDDPMPRGLAFKRGDVSFAGGGPNTRSSHLFVTLGKSVKSLGREPWETPIGYVTAETMESTVSRWHTSYGDMPPFGHGPDPGRIIQEGQAYLDTNFPKLDYFLKCERVGKFDEDKKGLAAASGGAEALQTAMAPFRVRIDMNKGTPEATYMVVEILPEWAPLGAQRFRELVKRNFLVDARFFRVVPGFVAQFGLPADPSQFPRNAFPEMKDDPVKTSNVRGTLSFASRGPDTRTTQLFFNFGDNSRLDRMGFSPIGRIVENESALDRIYSGYGEKPDQGEITRHGNAYLEKNFPDLSFISSVEVVGAAGLAAFPVSHEEQAQNQAHDTASAGPAGSAATEEAVLSASGGDLGLALGGRGRGPLTFEALVSAAMVGAALCAWAVLVWFLVLRGGGGGGSPPPPPPHRSR